MPKVTGRVRDFGLGDLTGRHVQLTFTPTESIAVGPDGTLVLGPVKVERKDIDPHTGAFEVTLAPTTLLSPPTHFRIKADYFEASGRFHSSAQLGAALHVPSSGGDLRKLLSIRPPIGATAVDATDPGESVVVGGRWIDTSVSPARLRRRAA